MSTPTIVVHWLENSRSQRVLWLLEEVRMSSHIYPPLAQALPLAGDTADSPLPVTLELPYTVKKYSRDKKTMFAPPELRAIHPLGKSPVVTIEENGETITLAESGAIVEFVIERYGKGKLVVDAKSGGVQDRANYLYWLHYAEGSIMMPLMLSIVMAQMPRQAPYVAWPIVKVIALATMHKFVRPRLLESFGFVENSLAGKEFFVGDSLTGADIMMVFPAEGLEPTLGYEKYPNIKGWFDRVSQRPAYLRALEKGGANRVAAFNE
ncbi:hypothetical protein RQP46_003965 [Phenoliferia psychrophenolica]